MLLLLTLYCTDYSVHKLLTSVRKNKMEELTPNLSMYIHPVVIVVTAPIWVSLRMLESACEKLIDRVPHSSSSQSDEIKKNSNNTTPSLRSTFEPTRCSSLILALFDGELRIASLSSDKSRNTQIMRRTNP